MKSSEEESSDADHGETVGTGNYVTQLGPHDVLLGRGTGPSNHKGNVHFRIAVEAMKSDYISTPSRKAKNQLVRKTIEAIKAKNGRFLSKLRKSETKMLGMHHKVVYEVVTSIVAIEKTKQAIRYVHYKKDAHQRIHLPGSQYRKRAPQPDSDDGEYKLARHSPRKRQASSEEITAHGRDQQVSSDVDTGSSSHSNGQERNSGRLTSLFSTLPTIHATLLQQAQQQQSHFAPQLSTSALSSHSMPLTGSTLFPVASNPLHGGSMSHFPGGNMIDYASQISRRVHVPGAIPFPTSSQQSHIFPAGNPAARSASSVSTGVPNSFSVATLHNSFPSNHTLSSSDELAVFLQHHRSQQVLPPVSQQRLMSSEPRVSAADRLLVSLQRGGQLQKNLQDDQLLAALLADERYRQLRSSTFFSNLPPGGG